MAVRVTFVHADEYAAGIGRKRQQAPQVDIDPWTEAALDLRKAIALGPLRPPGAERWRHALSGDC